MGEEEVVGEGNGGLGRRVQGLGDPTPNPKSREAEERGRESKTSKRPVSPKDSKAHTRVTTMGVGVHDKYSFQFE